MRSRPVPNVPKRTVENYVLIPEGPHVSRESPVLLAHRWHGDSPGSKAALVLPKVTL